MKHLAPQDRPREKLERVGAHALGDNELLAVLVGHGTAHATALEVANGVLGAAGGVHGLTRLHREEIAAVPGVGVAVAARVQAAVELGRRTLTHEPPERPQMLTAHDMAGVLLPRFSAFAVERFGILLMDARHRLIRACLLSSGSRDTSMADSREIFREAILSSACALALFHNHPSGDPIPSADDYVLTRRVIAAGAIVGVDVVDHLVLADNRYCSIRQIGHLSWPG